MNLYHVFAGNHSSTKGGLAEYVGLMSLHWIRTIFDKNEWGNVCAIEDENTLMKVAEWSTHIDKGCSIREFRVLELSPEEDAFIKKELK